MKAARAKRLASSPDPSSVVGNTRDVEILETLAWAGALTTSQLTRLHFQARRRAQRRLRALLDHGLVRAHLQGEALQRENVYTLSPLGLDLVVERGAFLDGPPPLGRMPAPGKLRHALLVRDAFVAWRLAERAGALALDDFRFEGELAAEPTFRPLGVIPDALVVATAAGRAETTLLELDAGTETTTTLRAKFEKYRRGFASGAGVFGAPGTSLLVLVVREGRARTMEPILASVGLRDRSRVVLLGTLDEALRAERAQGVGARDGRAERPVLRARTPS